MADRLLDSTVVIQLKETKVRIKQDWQAHNLIEETALEKARQQMDEFIKHLSIYGNSCDLQQACNLRDMYDRVINELEARIKELEEGKK